MAKQPAKGRKTPTKSQNMDQKAQKASESAVEKTPVIDAIPAEVHPAVVAKDPAPTEKQTVPPVKSSPSPEPVEKPHAPTPALKPAQRNSVMPLVLGGVIAGVIGFGVANLTAPSADDTLAPQVAAQSGTIAALEEQVARLSQTELTEIEDAQAALSLGLEDVSATLVDVTTRLTALEARPAGAVVDGSAVESEMDALRAQIAEMTGAAETELQDARAAAASIEQNATAAARNLAGRAALARVQTAMESGAPIGAALADLEEAIGQPAPDALVAVQDGVSTLAALQDQFPEAARAALAAARSEGVSGERSTGIGAFIRNQLDVRSTAPRDGDDADAILSRAEDAMRSGRLSDALAEISALPDVSRAAFSEWLSQAEARASAVAAVDTLSTTLSDN